MYDYVGVNRLIARMRVKHYVEDLRLQAGVIRTCSARVHNLTGTESRSVQSLNSTRLLHRCCRDVDLETQMQGSSEIVLFALSSTLFEASDVACQQSASFNRQLLSSRSK